MTDARRYAVWPEPRSRSGHSREVDRQSPTGLIFFTPGTDVKFQGKPLHRGRNIYEGKFSDFRQESPFISETVPYRPIVTMER